MSAQDQMRAMLDQLMGTGRDGEKREDQVHYSDHRVCRSFLLGCCPHEVLSSTRMDLGDCPKIHEFALRADYAASQKKRDNFYDLDALEHLERFFDECDRKTELAKKRLVETQEELSSEASEKAENVLELNEHIGKTLAEAERLGTDGNVEESLKLMEKVEELKKQKSDAEMDYRNSMPASSYQQQKLRVCEICGAFLGIHDNDRRLADHFGGKLHMGFVFLRERLEEMRANATERRNARETKHDRDRYESSSRGRGDSSRRRRSRSRSRDRHSASKKRSRSRDRSERRRSRKRSRENDRSDRASRSRSRSRSSKHKRRSSSKSHKKEKLPDVKSIATDPPVPDNPAAATVKRKRSRERRESGSGSPSSRNGNSGGRRRSISRESADSRDIESGEI